jgi:hypothetical protein
LNWAAKASDCGYFFKDGGQPSCDKVIQTLYTRYNMKGLIPKEKHLYLPYSKRTLSVVYFDASEGLLHNCLVQHWIRMNCTRFTTSKIPLLSHVLQQTLVI